MKGNPDSVKPGAEGNPFYQTQVKFPFKDNMAKVSI